MSQSGSNQYDLILTAKVDATWDESKISQLGQTIADLSSKFDPLNLDENQKAELKKYGIDSVENLFTRETDSTGNIIFRFSKNIEKLGTSALPAVIKEIQAYGRAMTNITKTTKKYAEGERADSRYATSYRNAINAGRRLNEIQNIAFGNDNVSSIFGDVVHLVSERYKSLEKTQISALSRDVWGNILSEDKRLLKDVTTRAKRGGVDLGGNNGAAKIIKQAMPMLGQRAMIDDTVVNGRRAHFAPLYQHAETLNEPNDIFRHKAIKELYSRSGEKDPGYISLMPESDANLVGARKLYRQIRRMQENGNTLAQKLALETGLAWIDKATPEQIQAHSNGHDEGLYMHWAANPTRKQLGVFLARAMQEGRQIKAGQGIYEHDPDNNYNVNKAMQEVIEISNAYAKRAEGKNGQAFVDRIIKPFGVEDLADLSWSGRELGKVTSVQRTGGRMPTYAIPYTVLKEDAEGNLSFVERTRGDMQKITKSGRFIVSKDDEGILVNNSQLTKLLGLNSAGGAFGAGFEGSGHERQSKFPDKPVLVGMDVADAWARNEQGYLKTGKEKELTKLGELYEKSIESDARYGENDDLYQFIYSNSKSAFYSDKKQREAIIAARKEKGIDNPFYGYDPQTPQWYYEGISKKEANKLRTSAKRIGTQGIELSEINPTLKDRPLKVATFSVEAQNFINKELGLDLGQTIPDKQLVDGFGFISPTIAPFSFQARGLGSNLKGVLGNYNWQQYIQEVVEKNPNAKSSPFITFDDNGIVSQFFMPSVAYAQIEDEKRKKSIVEAIRNGTKFEGLTGTGLISKYFEDLLDTNPDILLEENMLKGKSKGTVKELDDYVKFMVNNFGITEKEANERLEEKRRNGDVFNRRVGDDLIDTKFVRLNRAETNANLSTNINDSGLFEVKSDEDFSTSKRKIGRQLAEAIGFNHEMKKRSAELYAQRFAEMEDADYWIERNQFADRADIHSRFEQAEDKYNFIKTDKQALEYIQDQKDALKKQQLTHYLIDNESATKVALPLLGSTIQAAIYGNGAQVKQSSPLAWTFTAMLQNPKFLKNNLGLSDEVINELTIKDGENKGKIDLERIMHVPGMKDPWAIGGRTPSALDTFSLLFNLASTGASLDSLQGGGGDTVMLSPDAMYRMNTGDFDGDTIWLYSHLRGKMGAELKKGLSEANALARLTPDQRKEIENLLEEQDKELERLSPEKREARRQLEQQYTFLSGQGEMGKASALMRNALDLYDTNTPEGREKFARAYNLGSLYYDHATSQGQNEGWVGNYGLAAISSAALASRQFSRFEKVIADSAKEENNEYAQPSIFSHRLRSIHNIKDVAEALEKGHVRMDLGGESSGFGELVNDWIVKNYGVRSQGYSKTLFDFASYYGKLLAGQEDLSYLETRDKAQTTFTDYIKKLEAEYNSTTDADVKDRLENELRVIRGTNGNGGLFARLFNHSSAGNGAQGEATLFSDVLEDMREHFAGTETGKMLEDAIKVNQNLSSSDLVQILQDSDHDALIEANKQEYVTALRARKAFTKGTVGDFIKTWEEIFADNRQFPTTTMLEPYLRDVTALPVERVYYDENGEAHRREGYYQIQPEFNKTNYQKRGIVNQMQQLMHLPETQENHTVFGSFVHDAFRQTIMQAEKERVDKGLQEYSYTEGNFRKIAKDIFDNGTLSFNGKQVAWKDYLKGAVSGLHLENPLSDEQFKKISNWLGSESDELLDLGDEKQLRLQQKLNDTFKRKGNKNEAFIKDLLKNGALFEAENLIYNKEKGEHIPYGTNQNMYVNDVLGERGEKTKFRPDMLWSLNGNELTMFDWKPSSEAAEESIYQMIKYAKQAEIESKRVHDEVNAKIKEDVAREQAIAGLSDEDKRWYQFRDDEDKFKVDTLRGVDYTGMGDDIIFNYAQHPELVNQVVNGDFKAALERFRQDRKGAGILKGFDYMLSSGLVSRDDDIDETLRKYLGNVDRYSQLEDAIKEFRESPSHIRSGSDTFKGQDFIADHSQEWDFLVARYAQNRNNLDQIMEKLHSSSSKYRSKALTNFEYSQFDALYDDMSKLEDPEMLTALRAVYKDVLPVALQDIDEYDIRKGQGKDLLDSIVENASILDPMLTEEALRRQLYGSKGSNVYDRVRGVVGQANASAGIRQSLKKPYKKFFESAKSSDEKEDVWARAGAIELEANKYANNDKSAEAEEARKARTNFIAELRSQHSSVFTGKNRINTDEFMMSAARFAEAESAVGKLRQTEANLISKIFENDLNQIDRTVNRLTGKKETLGPKFLNLIEDKKQAIDDQIQSYIMDNSETDRIAQDYINKISTKKNPKNFKKSVKAAYDAGNEELLKTLSESAKDSNSKDAIAMLQHLVAKKNKTSDAIKILSDENPVKLYAKDMGKAMGKAAMSGVTSPFKMLYNQFSRRIMMSAISEIQNFVKQYNAAMTEIQMITLKSNDQISQLGSGLIDLAKDLKVSVSDITSSAAALYRQGLSDEEVNERLEMVTKFSKVSGTKATDATKLITTAINTGLVDSAQEAADVVTILGDSAATNAAQIEKGIEKAGAAAAVDGTSFGELTALLTAITATTQVTGNVAGTTLNSIFGRMNKVGMNDLIYDENGKAISGSDIATLLRAQGIDYQDENGKKRSTFAILKDLSQSYDTMSDLEQRQLATAIAGTRQYSNFGAIMTAFKEGEMDRYMDLLGNAEGITDKKYDVYLKSLNASLTELKSTFDGLVADLTDSGVLTSVINFLTGAIQGVDNLSKSAGGLAAALMPVVAIMAGMGLMKMGGLGFVAGAALVGGGLLAANFAGKSVSATEKYQEDKAAALEYTDNWSDKIKRARDLNSRRNTLSEEEKNELGSLTKELAAYASVGSSADDAATSLEVLKGAIDLVGDSAANTSKVIKEAEDKNNKRTARDIFEGQNSQAAAIAETVRNFENSFGTTEDTVAEDLAAENFFIKDGNGRYTYNKHFDWNNWDNNNISYENFDALAETLGKISQGFTSETLKDYANYSKEDWKTELFNPKSIPSEVYDALALYYSAIGSKSKSDQLKDVLNTDLTDLLTGVVPDEDLYNVVGGLTDKIVGSVLDENGSLVSNYADIISELLREVYGFDITDSKNLFNLDNLYKRIGNYGKASAKHDSSYVGTVTYNGKEYGSYADAYEQYSKDHPIEQADYNPNDVSETSELFYKSPNYDKDSGVGHILKANNIEAFKNSEDVVADFLDEINQGEKKDYTKEQLDILFDEFLNRNTQKRWRDLNTGLAHTTKESAIQSAIKNSEVSSQYNGEYYSNDEDAEAQRRSDFENEITFNDIEGIPKKEKAKQTKSAFYTDYHNATKDENNGYSSKNGTALAVDAIVSELLSGEYGNGVEGLNNFIKTVETNPNLKLAWNKAIENQAIQNLLDTQVSFDETTGLAVSSPEDIIDQLIRTGMSNGLVYKEQTLSTKQQAKLAQNAYTNLQNGSTLASSKVRENLIQAAQEEADNAEKELNQLLNQDSLNFTGNQLFANQRRINTAKEKLRSVQNTTALSPEEVSAMQNMYGVNLADKMISGQRLTDIEQNYVNAVDKTRSKGLTDFTTSQKLTNLKEARRLAKEARTEGAEITEEEILADYLSGMSNARDYLDLAGRKDIEAGKEGALTNEEIQRLAAYEAELDSLETEYEVTIETQGLESLEKAGKLLEGTVDLIGQLKKGGKFAIEASIKFTSDLQQQAQYDAMLNSDNIQLQNEALEALSGQKVTAENRARLMKQTKKQREYEQGFAASTILKAYQTGKYTLEQAEQAGYSPIYDGISNYTLPEGFYIGENGDVYRSATGHLDEFQTRIKNSKSRGSVVGFRYTGNEYSPDNPYYGTEKNYTDAELAQMRQNILNGSLTATQEGYATALQSGGEEWQEYQRLVANRQTAIDEAKRAYEQDTVAYEAEVATIDARIEAQKTRAKREETETWRGIAQGMRGEWTGYEEMRLAASGADTEENRNTLMSYFGIDNKQAGEIINGNGAENELVVNAGETLLDKTKQKIEDAFKNVDINLGLEGLQTLDLSTVTDFDSLIAELEAAANNADDATRERIQALINSLNGAAEAASQSFSEAFTSAHNKLAEDTYAYQGLSFLQNNATNYDPNSGVSFADYITGLTDAMGQPLWNSAWNNAVFGNAGVVAATSLFQNRQLALPDYNAFIGAQLNGAGKNFDYYDLITRASMGRNYQNGEFNAKGLADTLNKIKGDKDLVGFYDELISKFPELEDAAKGSDSALKALNENWKASKAAEVTKYAKGIDGLGDAITDIAKGGTAAKQGWQKIDSEMKKLQDRQTALEKARGKSGKQLQKAKKGGDQTLDIFAELFPSYDADQIAAMSEDEIQKLIDEAGPMISEQFADTIEALFNTIPHMDPTINLADLVTVHADGSVDLNDVNDVLSAAEEEIVQKILSLVGTYAKIDVGAILSGDEVTVESFLKQLRKAGVKSGSGRSPYNRSSGGGGGGGKSAAQKAVDDAKHAVSQAEHAANLAEANIYHPDKVNNFGGYIASVQANIAAQQSLAETQRQQISMLEAQRAATEYASDDWWSLTEAINGYEESLAKLEETIDSINQKIFEEAKEQHGYQISARQHGINMSSIDRTFYQRTNNYDAEEDTIDNLIEKNNALADSYFEALATYQGLANAEFAVNGQSDYWWSIQQEIDSTTESLAELKNTIDELNAEKIQIVIERQENEDKPENNAFSLMDLYKSRYQNTEDYTAYYTLMAERKQLTEEAIAQNRSQVAELEAQLAKYRIGSDEWIETRDQIWSVKLDTATKENELVDLEIELAEQRLAQLTQNYDRKTAYMNHANTMYDTYSQMYEKVDNNAGYRSALSNQIEMFEQLRDSAIKARDAALQQMATLEKGTKGWYEARDAAYQYAEAAAQAYATGLEKQYAIEESYANELIEGYNNRMSITNQPIKLLQDEEKAHSTVSDYDSYIGATRKEIELLTEQAAEGEKTIEQLKAQLEETTKGTPAWENLRKEILSVEQSVSSLQNSILDKNYEIEKSLGAQLRETFNDTSAITNQQIKFAQDSQRVYSGVSNYDSLIGSYQEEIKFEKESIEQKKEYIEQQKALLAQTTKGTAEWKQKRSEILSLEQQISATENSILEKTYAIETARATQLREQYSERAAIPTQELKLNQVQESVYGMFGDTSGQIASYQREIDITAELLSQKREQVAQQKELLAQMTKGTAGWKQQREEILATEQSIASLESSMAQNQLKIEASLASDLQESYSNDMSVYGQAMSLMENNIKLASSHNDYEGYLTGLRSERELVSARQASQAEYLDALKDRLSNTTINTTTWKNLRKQILDVEKALSDTGVELDNIEQKIGTSKIDFYLEAMDRAQRERDHAITMAEYEMTRYQNAGEWTNYGIMLEKVTKKREEDAAALEKDIALLKEELNQTDKSTKEYQRLIEQIEKKEETLAKDNNTIEENNKLLKENQDRIRKTRITLEEMVETEIKKRIEQEKAELNATVDLQNDVLDVIRQRYKDEWDLVKKDIDKKKDAMSKEKSLINERLQARKDAIDKESKYEELRELQNQLALISSDPTRSRDAAEVRKRINELNKDISMDIATDEADSATERIDEQIQAMEDWVSLNEENLNEMLEDARNFSEEVTGVLGGTYEQFVEWMSVNNTKFVTSLDEARQKMDTDWKDTWNTMTGYVETFRKQIDETLTSVENLVNFMSNSRDFIYATSETEQEQMIADWTSAYEDMESAYKISDEALDYQFHEHDEGTTDDVADQIEKGMTNALQNYDNSSWWGSGLQAIIPSVLTGDYDGSWFNTGIESKPETIATRPYDDLWTALGLEPEVESTRTQSGMDYDDSFWESGREPEADTMVDEAPEVDSYNDLGLPEPTTASVPTIEEFKDMYKDVGVDMSDLAPSEWVNKNKYVTEMPSYGGSYGGYSGGYGGGSGGSGGSGRSGGSGGSGDTPSGGKFGVELNSSGVAELVRYTDNSGTYQTRKEALAAAKEYNEKHNTRMKDEVPLSTSATKSLFDKAVSNANKAAKNLLNNLFGKTTSNAEGGIVDYTGYAWVDGTPKKPEAFLDAEDTANVRAMLDAFNYIKSPAITVPNRDWFGSSSTVGDINITINQAELKDDADYDEVARKVGQSFVKQLSRNGLNLNGYSF